MDPTSKFVDASSNSTTTEDDGTNLVINLSPQANDDNSTSNISYKQEESHLISTNSPNDEQTIVDQSLSRPVLPSNTNEVAIESPVPISDPIQPTQTVDVLQSLLDGCSAAMAIQPSPIMPQMFGPTTQHQHSHSHQNFGTNRPNYGYPYQTLVRAWNGFGQPTPSWQGSQLSHPSMITAPNSLLMSTVSNPGSDSLASPSWTTSSINPSSVQHSTIFSHGAPGFENDKMGPRQVNEVF